MTTPLYASQQYIDFFFSDSLGVSRPTEWKIALHTGDAGKYGGANEPFTGPYSFYERQDVTFTIQAHPSDTHYFATNAADITFPTGMSQDNLTITHYTIRDKVADEALASGRLPTPIAVSEGVNIVIPMGTLIIRGI